jgi:predicted dinucleotide-binding enzyme
LSPAPLFVSPLLLKKSSGSSGDSVSSVFEQEGYDVSVIGKRRIDNTMQLLAKSKAEPDTITLTSREYKALQAEILILRQQLETVKKILAAQNRAMLKRR